MATHTDRQPLRGLRGERGETLVEFAFASVLFFTFIFGILLFGIGVWNYNLVSNLAQEGARYAAVHGQNSGTPISTTDVANFVTSRAVNLSPLTVTTPLGAPSTKVVGDIIHVRVSYTLNLGGGIVPLWNFPVVGNAQMVMTR